MEPSTLQQVTMDAQEFYNLMIEAHKQAALVLAQHPKELERWKADGSPVRKGPGGMNFPEDGYGVLTVGAHMQIKRYLKDLRQRIEFVGNSYNKDIVVSWDEFQRYAVPNYRLKD